MTLNFDRLTPNWIVHLSPAAHHWREFSENVSNTLQDIVLTMFRDARTNRQKQYASSHTTLGRGIKPGQLNKNCSGEYLSYMYTLHVKTTQQAVNQNDCKFTWVRVMPDLIRRLTLAAADETISASSWQVNCLSCCRLTSSSSLAFASSFSMLSIFVSVPNRQCSIICYPNEMAEILPESSPGFPRRAQHTFPVLFKSKDVQIRRCSRTF